MKRFLVCVLWRRRQSIHRQFILSGTWYNNFASNSGWNALTINSLLFQRFPDLAYDSYLTIGRDGRNICPELTTIAWGHQRQLCSSGQVNLEPSFGNNFTVDDSGGAWFTTFPDLAADGTTIFLRRRKISGSW